MDCPGSDAIDLPIFTSDVAQDVDYAPFSGSPFAALSTSDEAGRAHLFAAAVYSSSFSGPLRRGMNVVVEPDVDQGADVDAYEHHLYTSSIATRGRRPSGRAAPVWTGVLKRGSRITSRALLPPHRRFAFGRASGG